MKLNIIGRHMDITDGIRAHAEESANKMKHFKDVVDEIDLIVEKEHTDYKVSATFDVFKKKHHMDSKESDLYDAIDRLMDKIEKTIKKDKDKITDHSRRKSVSEVSSMSEEQNEEDE